MAIFIQTVTDTIPIIESIDDSGIGCQVMAADINKDGKPDVIVGNKKGCFVHLQK